MNGISEEYFISLCESLYNEIYKKFVNQETKTMSADERSLNEAGIMLTVNEIIDASHGYIQTENKEIKNIFEKVYIECGCIYNFSMRLSHHKRLIQDALDDKDDDALAEAIKLFTITRTFISSASKRAFAATKEALKFKNQKEV